VNGELVGGLFYDAFSVTRLCNVDDGIMMNWKGFGRKRSLEGLRETTKNH
jgi:hypothetical protein